MELLIDLPDWPSTHDITSRILAAQADAERRANPAYLFLDALEQALASGSKLVTVHGRWCSRTSVRPSAHPEIRPGQTPVWRIDPDDDLLHTPPNGLKHPVWIVIPREVCATLNLSPSVKAIGDSLASQGALWTTFKEAGPERNACKIRIYGHRDGEPDRLARAWVILDQEGRK